MLIDILFINHFRRSYRDKNVKARPGFSITLRYLHYISQSLILIILMFLVMIIRINMTSMRKNQRHINIHSS